MSDKHNHPIPEGAREATSMDFRICSHGHGSMLFNDENGRPFAIANFGPNALRELCVNIMEGLDEVGLEHQEPEGHA